MRRRGAAPSLPSTSCTPLWLRPRMRQHLRHHSHLASLPRSDNDDPDSPDNNNSNSNNSHNDAVSIATARPLSTSKHPNAFDVTSTDISPLIPTSTTAHDIEREHER